MPPVKNSLSGVDRRAELLPADLLPLFDDRFVRTCDLYEEYVYRLALGVFRESGLEACAVTAMDATELVRRAGLDDAAAIVPVDWLLRTLASRGALERLGGSPARYGTARRLPSPDPEEVLALQEEHDASALPSYRIARVAAECYPAFLRGEIRGEEALFSPGLAELWAGYFSNTNSLYAINNTIGSMAFERWARPGELEILELGGGLASGALALLAGLERAGRLASVRRYRFTDVAPPFLRRGQRALAAAYPKAPFLSVHRLDMNGPFPGQGIEPESLDAVYAVNTLHIARDMQATLAAIRGSLKPGGALVISECIRPFPGDAVYVEFVFNMLEPFRQVSLDPLLRPTCGFLSPEHWKASLERAGFGEVRFLPDVRRIREVYPSFVVGAIGATRV